jgi:hypothetical protein
MTRRGQRRMSPVPAGVTPELASYLEDTRKHVVKIDKEPQAPSNAFERVEAVRMNEHVILNFRNATGSKVASISLPNIEQMHSATPTGATTTITNTAETVWVLPCGFAVAGS